MHDNQRAPLVAESDGDISWLAFLRVVRIVEHLQREVLEYRRRLLERNTMLPLVCAILGFVPAETEFHTYIVHKKGRWAMQLLRARGNIERQIATAGSHLNRPVGVAILGTNAL